MLRSPFGGGLMKKFTVLLLLGVFMMLLIPSSSHAGPWTLKAGKTWVEIFSRYTYADSTFDPHYDRSSWNNGGVSEIYDVEGKIEYGVTDDFNLQLGIPYSWSFWRDDFSIHGPSPVLKNQGFKEIQIGGKYKFLKKPVVAAVQLKGFIYTYNEREKQPLLSEYGNAIEGRFMLGKAFRIKKRPAYVAGEIGYKLRMKGNPGDSDWANVIPVFLEGGFSPWGWLLLKCELDANISHRGTGRLKDTYTWRAGPIINLLGEGFSSVQKGGKAKEYPLSINLELQYGQTFLARGDSTIQNNPTWPNSADRVSAANEFIMKVQFLF